MKKQLRTIFGLAILLTAVSAYAEIQQTLQAKVAFPFVAGGKMFPAAVYRVRIVQSTGLITLSTPGVQSATMLTNTNERRDGGDHNTNLTFERHGDNWVLSQVDYDGTQQLLHLHRMNKESAMPKSPVATIEVTPSISGN